MKSIEQVNAMVVDYGTFMDLPVKLAQSYAKTRLYLPSDSEYLDVEKSVKGFGLQGVERVEDMFDPEIIKTTDLFIFPDRGFVGPQKYLRSIGKAVWGSFDACYFEESRTQFIDLVKKLGLPLVKSVEITGLSALAEHLKKVEDKWIKINKFRSQMETFHHLDYDHSKRELEHLAVMFGGVQDEIVFVVQDTIKDAQEIGYDGYCIDGEYPDKSYGGYEKKNELYLGTWEMNDKLPKQVLEVNEAIAPMLKKIGYRNSIATEIRVQKGKGYFIDPTFRTPGQTGEHQMETMTNLAEVIWNGANGILVNPEFSHRFAAEATLHYTAGCCDEWKVLTVPEEIEQWVKLYHYCRTDDGLYHFPPSRNDEVGVICAVGNTIEETIDTLKKTFDELKGEPLSIHSEEFAELIEEIKKAESKGIKFTDQEIPEPEIAL